MGNTIFKNSIFYWPHEIVNSTEGNIVLSLLCFTWIDVLKDCQKCGLN